MASTKFGVIEKNIPIPSGQFSETLRSLQVGDSVTFAGKLNTLRATVARVFGSGNFVTRTVEGGIRVWRKK